jgi:hypothetical protein
VQDEYSYTRFVVESGGLHCHSIACDLEARRFRVVNGKSENDLSFSLMRWSRLSLSQNLDERMLYQAINDHRGYEPAIFEGFVTIPMAQTALEMINSREFSSYPKNAAEHSWGYRDGWWYNVSIFGDHVSPVRIKYLTSIFPKGQEPPCEKFIMWVMNNLRSGRKMSAL